MKTVFLTVLLGLCSYTDVKDKYIRTSIVCLGGIIGVICRFFAQDISCRSMIGGMCVGLGLVIFSILSKGKMGLGDGLLVTVVGVYLGFWNTLSVVFISTLCAGIFGMIIIKIKNKSIGYELPFAPFLMMGYIVGIICSIKNGVML